jgi:hypothetical protein
MFTIVPGVPEFGVVDLFNSQLSDTEREEVFDAVVEVHSEYFPSYAHVLADFRTQVETNTSPPGERVHEWLVMRDGKPAGVWTMNVNPSEGIVMMLFGAIHRDARIDLPREYLPRLVNFLLGLCIEEAHELGFELIAAILESDAERLPRWESCGFFVADPDYREPKHGIHWAEFGDPEFYSDYSACVMAIDAGIGLPAKEIASIAIRTLLVDHYHLPSDHEAVISSLQRASQVGS